LAQDGVAFYAMIQRALAIGAATQGKARHADAGTTLARDVERWQPLGQTAADVLLSARWINAGAYENNENWLALNRPANEDITRIMDAREADRLFNGLEFRHVEQTIGDTGSLASEIWRAFLVLMGVALFSEAWLCMPEKKPAKAA
jgi:hypothetical protein